MKNDDNILIARTQKYAPHFIVNVNTMTFSFLGEIFMKYT